jgi:two-component sensor histidine kinase
MLEGNWERTDLRGIIEAALEPFLASGGSIRADGPSVALYPSQAKALSMVFYELATNASKYGALKVDSGRVDVTWSMSGADTSTIFGLRWSETSGPATQPPQHQGFGTRMIHAMTASELGGEATFAFLESGLVCEIKAPANRLPQLNLHP